MYPPPTTHTPCDSMGANKQFWWMMQYHTSILEMSCELPQHFWIKVQDCNLGKQDSIPGFMSVWIYARNLGPDSQRYSST